MARKLLCFIATICGVQVAAQEWRVDLPPMRASTGQTLVFDERRGRTLSFGNATGFASFKVDHLWTYDGERWDPVEVPGQDLVRDCLRAVYDIARDRVVAVIPDSVAANTFEFDGQAWSQVFPPTQTPRPDALVYDVARQVTVMVRGFGPDCQTWEYDGTDWVLRVPFPRPPSRQRMRLAYDRARQLVVMYGGYANAGQTQPFSETWEYDGAGWNQVTTATTPVGQGALCYDEVGGRTLMVTTSTWSYDGVDWSQLTSGASVGQMAYDRDRDVVVGLGLVSTSSGVRSNVAEFANGQWETRFTQPTIESPSMFSDHANERVLLFSQYRVWQRIAGEWSLDTNGGHGSRGSRAFDPARGRVLALQSIPGGLATELWQWDAGNWSMLASWPSLFPAVAPEGNAMLAYDVGRDRVVAFGGRQHVFPTDETYEWHGGQWQPLTGPAPPGRFEAAMVYSHALQGVVLFGGKDWGVTPLADTWLLRDGVWQQIVTPTSPPGRSGHSLCEDRARGVILMRGGTSQVYQSTFASTWEFDGSDWSVVLSEGPEQGENAAIAIDPWSGELVTVGGITPPNSYRLQRPGEAVAARYGVGCQGSNGVPDLASDGALPALGATIDVALTNLPPSSTAMLWFGFDVDLWNGSRLPLELAPLGLVGCRMWVAPAPGLAFPLVASSGAANVQLTLPSAPSFQGQQFAAQALVLDSQLSSGATTSNAVLWSLW